MKDFLDLTKKLIPEQMNILIKRYRILRTISVFGPIGRRNIGEYLKLSERSVRGETEKLKAQKLIEVSKNGMIVTKEGKNVLDGLKLFVKELTGISLLEERLKEKLEIEKVCIISNDNLDEEIRKKELGKVASEILLDIIDEQNIVAITGGTTMSAVVNSITAPVSKKCKIVVPARGSIGRRLEEQSDTLASLLAEKLGAEYKMLGIPDNISQKTINEIKNEPIIKNTLYSMQNTSILIMGIGNAINMAEKRRVSKEVMSFLLEKKAVAEAMGSYFDENGKFVYSSASIGINFEDVEKIPKVIAVAGGSMKADSIVAITNNIKNIILVTDMYAVKKILNKLF